MNTAGWIRSIDDLHAQGMRVFVPAQLALVSRVGLGTARKQIGRLVEDGLLQRLARGIYARPGRADLADLLSALDNGAYFTGISVLNRAGIVDQVPARHFAVTDKQHARVPARKTAFGTIRFHTITRRLYRPPAEGVYVSVAQAICDLLYFNRRRGLGLGVLRSARSRGCSPRELRRWAKGYPAGVRNLVEELLGRLAPIART